MGRYNISFAKEYADHTWNEKIQELVSIDYVL